MRAAVVVMVTGLLLGAAGCTNKKKDFDKRMSRLDYKEAEINLNRLFKAARMYHTERGTFVAGKVGPTPGGAPWACAGGKPQPHDSMNGWTGGAEWDALDFRMDSAFKYSYAYEGDATGFTVTAQGDLDCDGTPSTFKMTGKLVDGNVQGGELEMDQPNE